MIGLLKKPRSICLSGWRGIWNVFLVICWVQWGPRTKLLVLLPRCYYPGLDYSTFAAQARYLGASAVWKPSFMYGYPLNIQPLCPGGSSPVVFSQKIGHFFIWKLQKLKTWHPLLVRLRYLQYIVHVLSWPGRKSGFSLHILINCQMLRRYIYIYCCLPFQPWMHVYLWSLAESFSRCM